MTGDRAAPGRWYQWQADELLLYCQLQPGANADAIVGVHGARLKLRIAAAPVEGRANLRLRAFLASRFGVALRAVNLEQGDRGRWKTVRIKSPRYFPAPLAISRP